jgi:hypothetical protein
MVEIAACLAERRMDQNFQFTVTKTPLSVMASGTVITLAHARAEQRLVTVS